MSEQDASFADARNETSSWVLARSNPGATSSAAARLSRDKSQGEENNHLYSFFLNNITTEFRTPLAALNASLQYLLGDLDNLSTGDIRELLQSVHLSVTGLQTLIDNLIESTHIEAGHFSIRTGAIDIRDVVFEAADFTRPLFKRRGQQIILQEQGLLPLICGDPPRLGQVMVNLLSSASKLGPMDQTVYVGLSVCEQKWLRVSVSDQLIDRPLETAVDGPVAPAAPERSGDIPYSVELGLSVARSIVEEHGGAFGVTPGHGGSSVYWFTVPTVEQFTVSTVEQR